MDNPPGTTCNLLLTLSMNTIVEKDTPHRLATANQNVNYLAPSANVFETQDAYVVQVEMPGVNRGGLDITLEGYTLTLAGRRESPAPPGNPVYVESKPADFRRVFEIEPDIDGSKVSAHLEQGLLTVRLPKAEHVKPRKVPVGD